jgi:DNA-binding Lrp family transcriptional regulator
MDQTDWQIIEILLRDARVTFSEIGKRLGLDKGSIQKRVKKLTNTRILGNPISILDAQKCGFEGIIDFFIKGDVADFETIKAELKSLPYILMIAPAVGDHNLYISSFFKNIKDIAQITDKIKNIKGVQSFDNLYYLADVANPLIVPFVNNDPERSIIYKLGSFSPKKS